MQTHPIGNESSGRRHETAKRALRQEPSNTTRTCNKLRSVYLSTAEVT